MTNLTLRDMQQRDLPDVRALILASFKPYAGLMHPELFRLYIGGLPPADADIPRTFLAETGGAIVATARLYAPGTARTPVGTPLPPDAAWVRAVAVRPDLAGRGIGRLMMGECERRAITQDAKTVMLHTLNFMQRAIQMYEGLGVPAGS